MTRRIDHLVVAVHDLDQAGSFYQRLGFQVGARNRHPWGTENRLVQLPSSFIELITVGEGAAIAPHQASLAPGSKVAEIYGGTDISERHRHRYEVNMTYRDKLEEKGMRFSGVSPDGVLPEIVEYENHPWFIGVQYHPELKSRPFEPHPLFKSFIHAAVEQSRLV